MIDFYVYYKVAPAHRDAARAAVDALLAAVQDATGVRGALSRRVDDPLTWMESYPAVADAIVFEAALQCALDQSGLSGCLVGVRHVERFCACA